MDATKAQGEATIEAVVQLLHQILRLYKAMGPQSMESLTKSYLADAPSAETAQDAAEGMMAQAFQVFDDGADWTLRSFAAQRGFDLAQSATYRRRLDEGYFRVVYPILVLLMAWIDREKHADAVQNLDKLFQSAVLGVAGYMLLDTNLDEQTQNSAEILLAIAMIHEHDRLLLETFGATGEAYALLSRFKQLYLQAELHEKQARFVQSPYRKDHAEDCGYKAVHGYLPFALILLKSGRADQIDDYLQFFYVWGAPLQIMDDIVDLEEDLRNGHYSYPTLGFEAEITRRDPAELARMITADVEHMRRLQILCQNLIDDARERCNALKADLMAYMVDILEARLRDFFAKMVGEAEQARSSAVDVM